MSNNVKIVRLLALFVIAVMLFSAVSFVPGAQAQEQQQTPTGTQQGETPGAGGQAQQQGCEDQYTVVSGDTLGHIALRCGVTVAALLGANPEITDRSRIVTGQVINVPGQEGGIPVTGGGIWAGLEPDMAPPRFGGLPAGPVQATQVPGGVQPTLQATATQAAGLPGVTETPAGMETPEATATQPAGLPAVTETPGGMETPAVTVTQPAGQPGLTQTPAGQVETPEVTATEAAGQVETPEATVTEPAGQPGVTETPGAGALQSYTIQSGDTLQSIAAQFGVTVEQLLQANPQLVQPGEVLNIPAAGQPAPGQPTQPPAATVRPTDTRQPTFTAVPALPTDTRQPTPTEVGAAGGAGATGTPATGGAGGVTGTATPGTGGAGGVTGTATPGAGGALQTATPATGGAGGQVTVSPTP